MKMYCAFGLATLTFLFNSFGLVDLAVAGEYFPLREGLTKEFRVVLQKGSDIHEGRLQYWIGPKINLAGTEVFPILTRMKTPVAPPPRKTFYLENEQGIRVIAQQGPYDGGPKMSEYDQWELKYPLVEGGTWTGTDELIALKGKPTVVFTYVIETMNGTASTPAGTFKKCMKVRRSYIGEVDLGPLEGATKMTVESYAWYAPTIGFIRGGYLMKDSGSEIVRIESSTEMVENE